MFSSNTDRKSESEHYYLAIRTPLYNACKTDDVKIAEEEIAKGYDLQMSVDKQHNTYLHVAVKHNSLRVVRLLVAQQTIRVDAENQNIETPVHLVRNVEILKELIAAGCDLNVLNRIQEFPIITLLMDHCLDFKVKYEMLQVLLEHGADPNNPASMHEAVFCTIIDEHEQRNMSDEEVHELISLLVLYGAEVNRKVSPYTSFMFAVRALTDDLLELLLPRVTNFNEFSSRSSVSLLMYAIIRKSSLVYQLIKNGADINYYNKSCSCVLLSALYKDNRLFKYMWNNCDKSYLLNKQRFLFKFVTVTKFEKKDFLESLYIILDSVIAIDLVAAAAPQNIYNNLIHKFGQLDIEKDDRVKVIYAFLTKCNHVSHGDLLRVYEHYGFDEELEAFLAVTVDILDFVPFPNFITRLAHPHNDTRCKLIGKPKSLLELSRDAIRKSIKPVKDGTYFKYYNEIQRLPVPQAIKDVICLKRPIQDDFV